MIVSCTRCRRPTSGPVARQRDLDTGSERAVDPLSHSGRSKLSADICRLATNDLSHVLGILREELPSTVVDAIDTDGVDMTKLSDATILRLASFVRAAQAELGQKRQRMQKTATAKRRKMTVDQKRRERAEVFEQTTAELRDVERDLEHLEHLQQEREEREQECEVTYDSEGSDGSDDHRL